MLTSLSLSRLHWTGTLCYALFMVIEYWLMLDLTTGIARLMLQALTVSMASQGLWGLSYEVAQCWHRYKRTSWGERWFWVNMTATMAFLGSAHAMSWAGWPWLCAWMESDLGNWAWWLLRCLPTVMKGTAFLWMLSQCGIAYHLVVQFIRSKNGHSLRPINEPG